MAYVENWIAGTKIVCTSDLALAYTSYFLRALNHCGELKQLLFVAKSIISSLPGNADAIFDFFDLVIYSGCWTSQMYHRIVNVSSRHSLSLRQISTKVPDVSILLVKSAIQFIKDTQVIA